MESKEWRVKTAINSLLFTLYSPLEYMPKAKLLINGGEREISIGEGVTTVGRVADNDVSLADDSNVSRYHAEIETRGDDFWLIELGSSNGTTVGGARVYDEKRLVDGDLIVLGGSTEILFEIEKEKPKETPQTAAVEAPQVNAASSAANIQTPSVLPNAAAGEEAAIANDAAAVGSKLPLMLGVAAVVCGLAIVFVVAAVAISFYGGKSSKCEAKAKITNPENGDTITKETEIELETENTDCVKRAIFLIDGVEFASATEEPYKVSLNPKEFPELSDGGNHSLKVAFEDTDGNKFVQPDEVLLAFETISTPTPTPEPTLADEAPTGKPKPKKQEEKLASAGDTMEMCQRLLKQFAGSANDKLDPQFVQEVQKKTSEYAAAEGYFSRAEAFRDLINVEFHKENNLDAPLGYILAMSRSQFKPQKQGAEEGLWRLSDSFVTANKYKEACLSESLSDPSQNCAAKTTALYLNRLVIKIFNGDVVYAVAAFGMSEQEANQWQAGLPADRADFWKVLKTQPAPQRDQVVRFFAAGIVADNPQKFGLKKDQPISGLYQNLMGK